MDQHRRDYVNKRLLGKDSIEYWQNKPSKSDLGGKEGTGAGRDLIKEYFARTRTQEPPPIFQSNLNRAYPPAYFNSVDDMELEAVLNFVDENFKEIGVSSIIPEKKLRDQDTRHQAKPSIRKSESCHLIGKVNPNILRTWEQLNQNNDRDSDAERKDATELTKPQDPYYQRTNLQSQNEDLASFKVHYVTYDDNKDIRRNNFSSADDLYYDSIDEDDDASLSRSNSNAATTVSIICRKAEQQTSLMVDTDLYMGDPPGGGEDMAEFDSLDRNRFNWSLNVGD